MPDTLIAQTGFAIVVLVAVIAFIKGDEPERIGAGAYALAMFSSLLLQDETRLDEPQLALILIDTVMLMVYGALAWKSRRAWPAWAAGVQAVAVVAHLLMVVDLRPSLAAFYSVVNLANLAALAILCIGVFQAWKDRIADARGTDGAFDRRAR